MRSAVFAILAAFFSLATGAQAQFLNLPQYDDGTNLSSFVQADVNGDARADIIGVNLGEIVVLLNNGAGGFGSPVTTKIAGVDSPQLNFVLGDFNGDGHLDVAFFGKDHVTGQNALAVMVGNGDGTFQAGKETVLGSLGSPSNGACVANAADYNGDSKLDITYLSGNGGMVSLNVLLGKGDGTFSSPITTSLGTPFYTCIATGDFDNDKKLDLAIATNSGQIAMMLGKGNGTFQLPFSVGKGSNPIVAAELNGDGNLDLVAVQEGNSPSITVLLGDGTGHFPTKHTYNYGAQGTELFFPVAVQDLNGDGRPDLAFLTSFSHAPVVNILLNNGDGSFTPGRTYNGDGQVGPPTPGLFAADLNGDQKVDLAIGNGAHGISVLLGNGNGTFQGNFAVAGGPPFGVGLAAGKFTSNPAIDLVAANSVDQLLFSNGDGTFTMKKTICGVEPATIGDFNKDGKLDLAGPTHVGNVDVIGVCLGNGDGTFTVGGGFDQGITHRVALAGDFNNDGKLDLLASDQGGFSILLGDVDGTFQNGIPTAADASFPSLAFADFNNDGKLDVIMATSSGITVFLGKGDGTFEAPLVSPGPQFGLITVTDLNKDGKKDLVIAGAGGPVTVMLGKGDGTFQKPVNYHVDGGSSTRAVIGDFNLDGKLDVAVGSFSMIDVFFGDGTGKFSTTPVTFQAGDTVIALATSDFNRDKKPDLAVATHAGYVVTLLHQ